VLLGVLAFGQDVPAAVAAPRIHHQGLPPVLAVEETVPPETRSALERLGHRLRVVPAIGAVAATGIGPDGVPQAAGDARKDGGAALSAPRHSSRGGPGPERLASGEP
jgi:gamma-glutamyltranspeptidase